eukprot:scaffold354288_cov24-Prasinocladus_malaysianus.AAC.1
MPLKSLEVTTRIDPETDAVVMAGGVDVSGMSSSRALHPRDDTCDITQRHTLMAEESQTQMDCQVGCAELACVGSIMRLFIWTDRIADFAR